MYCVTVGASPKLRGALSTLLAGLLILAVTADGADAKSRKKRGSSAASSSIIHNPQYAAIVVDANNGDILHAANPDSLRHPASLTKIMTLYLLFERLESGKVKLDTPFEVSAHAASQAPSKLGLRPGSTISAEDAIKALVTKSANDIAVVIAEALAGSEDEFARQMTRKARALRMTKTVYKNASGLPDDDQVTTARDQALLGIAIQERFPRYYQYFSTRSFKFRGRNMANHNRLLGRVEGVDGIKTGYIRASGFNLVTSVRRGGRHIVATVLGGKSAGQRDARMRELIEARIVEASTRKTAPKPIEVAAAPEPAKRVASVAIPMPEPKPDSATTGARADSELAKGDATKPIPLVPQPQAGSTEPIKPRLVKTLTVRPGTTQVAAVAPLSLFSPEPITAQATKHSNETSVPTQAEAVKEDKPLPPPPGARPGVLGVLTARDLAGKDAPAREPKMAAVTVASADATASAAAPLPSSRPAATTREVKPRSGWIIQVGAFPDIDEARQRLSNAKTTAPKLLGEADSFTEPVNKGDKTLYRARFAGLKQHEAQAACRYLKQNDFVCMAIRN